MPKPLPLVHRGYYPIYNRGAGRQIIFREARKTVHVLRLLKRVATESDVTVVAYCLLPNHYHWLHRFLTAAGAHRARSGP